MNITTLTIADPGYLKRAARIVALYNEASSWHESPKLEKPSTTLIIAVEGDSGGLLLDQCTENGKDAGFYRVMFAAFDPDNRRKGFLRACIQYADSMGVDIRFVELNPFDDAEEAWARVGFDKLGTWGFTIVASRKKENFIHYGVSMHCASNKIKKEYTP